jgi:flagellar biosynthesis protein FlhF
MRENSATVRRYFNVLLRKLLPVRHEIRANSASKKIIMLVGPTGVGKTTTLAKLAARYAFKQDVKYKVGIITLDTYRIGAVEQLMQYAKMMKLSIEAVVDPAEFKTALSSLRGCDYILIDTVGSSHYDKKKINKLSNFIKAESSLSIDISLVLSANTKYEDLKEMYNNFSSELDIDTLIVTKLDETKCFGNMFSLLYDIKKPVSYFSTGQEVPEDLIVASSEFFVDCLLDGYKARHAK